MCQNGIILELTCNCCCTDFSWASKAFLQLRRCDLSAFNKSSAPSWSCKSKILPVHCIRLYYYIRNFLFIHCLFNSFKFLKVDLSFQGEVSKKLFLTEQRAKANTFLFTNELYIFLYQKKQVSFVPF